MRPTPPVLLGRLFDALADSSSTTPPLAPAQDKYKGRPTFALGPLLVSVLLTAGASLHQDPVTHITESTVSPEVEQHLLAFLHRPDQTPTSLAETIHVIAIAQPQSVEINADLLSFFDSPDEPVRYALLHDIQRLTLTASSFAQAQDRVRMLAADPAASQRIHDEAQRILPCWNNDRHRPGCSPY